MATLLTSSEILTVIAALRHYQNDSSCSATLSDIDDIPSENGAIAPLSLDEIDDLCERLNCDDTPAPALVLYPLRLFFDCSTVHLSAASRAFLDREATSSTQYGWFMWADETLNPDRPHDLSAIIAHARALGAEYILFDCDAPENESFTTFDDADASADDALSEVPHHA